MLSDPCYPQVLLDCRSVHRRVVPTPDTSLRSDLGELTAWLGQRNQDNFLFKVKLFSFQSVEVTSKGEGVAGGKIELYEVISLFADNQLSGLPPGPPAGGWPSWLPAPVS